MRAFAGPSYGTACLPPAMLGNSGRQQTGEMAHLAAWPWFAFAVEVEMRLGVGEQIAPSIRLVADQVAHLDSRRGQVGRPQRQPANRSDMVLELRGARALDRPMAAIVNPWRHLVEQGIVA